MHIMITNHEDRVILNLHFICNLFEDVLCLFGDIFHLFVLVMHVFAALWVFGVSCIFFSFSSAVISQTWWLLLNACLWSVYFFCLWSILCVYLLSLFEQHLLLSAPECRHVVFLSHSVFYHLLRSLFIFTGLWLFCVRLVSSCIFI